MSILSKDQERHLVAEIANYTGVHGPEGMITSYREGKYVFVGVLLISKHDNEDQNDRSDSSH
jgi:hypothetical protein